MKNKNFKLPYSQIVGCGIFIVGAILAVDYFNIDISRGSGKKLFLIIIAIPTSFLFYNLYKKFQAKKHAKKSVPRKKKVDCLINPTYMD